MNWNKELQAAESERNVVALVNDFLRDFAQKDLSGLPPGFVPDQVNGAADIDRWHFKLASEYCRPQLPWENVTRFQDLVVFFLSASKRLSELGQEAPPPILDSRPFDANYP